MVGKKTETDFNELWQFPNCVGLIDGKHVRIRALAFGVASTITKPTFSFILMAVCEAR